MHLKKEKGEKMWNMGVTRMANQSTNSSLTDDLYLVLSTNKNEALRSGTRSCQNSHLHNSSQLILIDCKVAIETTEDVDPPNYKGSIKAINATVYNST